MDHKAPRRTGVANLPLHNGRAPRWLFERMTLLAREITLAVATEFGVEDMVRKVSDPFWFQALGCILGFDWHSSGVTTTACGALKEGLRGLERELGLYVAGGKGRASRRTPAEIQGYGSELAVNPASLVYASRMAAKVDTVALQDGYELYHHTFFFSDRGAWAVVQQGMNESTRYARRYHWLGEAVSDFVCEPHAAICSDASAPVLNLVASESASARTTVAELASVQRPESLVAELKRLKTLELPRRHHIEVRDLNPNRLERTLLSAYERCPAGFEELIGLEGVGARTIRALALISELVYGVPSSFRDPARYSFAHGGKDGHPFPVDRAVYDKSIAVLGNAVRRARIGNREKLEALRRLGTVQRWMEREPRNPTG